MDVNLDELWEMVRDWKAGCAAVCGLFQGSVRNSKTAESQVSQRLLQLSEKASICSLLEILIWKKEDKFLTNAFYQLRLWNMVVNHIRQFIHIP